MSLAYTAPTWSDGSGTGISASQLQAISNCIEGLVQGTDKAIHSISMANSIMTVTFVDGTQENVTATGLKGISLIEKTGTSGLIDTYTITYTDGSTSTYEVTNGLPPDITITASADAISSDDPTVTVTKTGTDTNPNYNLAFSGLKGRQGTQGQPGAAGNGITDIVKTSTSGLVDTYTIYYTNGTTDTFTVRNGQDGQGAGDMTKIVYDSTNAVADAGGILAYVNPKIQSIYDFNAKTGVHQFLKYDLPQLKSKNTSGTWASNVYTADGVTITVEDDLSFTVNADGNMSGSAVVFELDGYGKFLPTGDYLLSGCTGGSATTYKVDVIFQTGTYAPVCYDGDVALSIANDINYKARIVVYKTAGALSNKVFKPLIRLAQDTCTDFTLPAMTNMELTEKVSVKSLTINLTASDKATKLRDDSRRCGNIVNIRIQLQVTTEIANGTEIFRLNGLPHTGYSIAILGNSNTGEIIPLLIPTSDSNFSASCKKTIPTGYYAISYTYIV